MSRFTFIFFMVLMNSQNLLAKESTIYLVRHAEVSYRDGNYDPSLTEEGKKRADDLRELLKEEPITQILATRFKRTQETAGPLADFKKIRTTIKNANWRVLKELLAFKHEAILVVGHSNTIPEILQEIGATEKELPEDHSVFHKLYILKLKQGNPATEKPEISLEIKDYGR